MMSEGLGNGSGTVDVVQEVDGGIQIYIIIIIGLLAIVVVAGIVSILIKIIMDRKMKETTETDEDNENYGNLDTTEQYYEEDKKSKIIHFNDYYK